METIQPMVVTSEFQVTKVNNVSITCIENDNKRFIPIRPICEALDIDVESQRKKIYDDEILGSVAVLSTATGSDGKRYEMLHLPLEFVFGWLFTINPKNVSPEARESVTRYKLQCYQALFEYFTEPQTFLKQKQEQMERMVTIYQEKQANFKNARKEMEDAKKELNKIMAMTIDDWRANNRQLIIPFESVESPD